LSRVALQKFPFLKIEGDIFPPPAWRSAVAKLVQAIKFGLIVTVICGIDVFSAIGITTPSFITYGMQNKVCLIIVLEPLFGYRKVCCHFVDCFLPDTT
ncbi:uncharacterized protein DEA37_0013276, partial [Paragonimus westermani]